MSDLKQQIDSDIKSAMRAKDKLRLMTLRMLNAALKQSKVDGPVDQRDEPFTNEQIISVIQKMIKERRDSAQHYRKGGADDRAEREDNEIEVLSYYMPEPLSDDELNIEISRTIEVVQASSLKDMGKVMQALTASLAGRADMGTVSQRVKSLLSRQ